MNYPILTKIMNEESFSFKLTPISKYRLRNDCLAISINPSNTILVIGS